MFGRLKFAMVNAMFEFRKVKFKKDADANHFVIDKLSTGLSRKELSKTGQSSGVGSVANRDSVTTGDKAMIGSTVVIEGQITSGEALLIEGKVSGTITAKDHEVTVGQSGELKADISAKIVRIEGKIEGDISGGEKVIISKSGNVLGNIDAPRVTLEDGAKFKGSIEMNPDDQAVNQAPIKAVVSGKPDIFSADSEAEKSKVS